MMSHACSTLVAPVILTERGSAAGWQNYEAFVVCCRDGFEAWSRDAGSVRESDAMAIHPLAVPLMAIPMGLVTYPLNILGQVSRIGNPTYLPIRDARRSDLAQATPNRFCRTLICGCPGERERYN
jgi:hypothetical protein